MVLRLARWAAPLIILAVVVATVGGATSHVAITYLPLFLFETLLAVILARSDATLGGRSDPWLEGAALVGLTAEWWVQPFVPNATVLALPVVILSAFGLVFVAARWTGAEPLLDAGWC